MISALLLESVRANNKQLSTVERAVERLRSNGKILAGRVDEKPVSLYHCRSARSPAPCAHTACTPINCCNLNQLYPWPAAILTTFGRSTPLSPPSSTWTTMAPRP